MYVEESGRGQFEVLKKITKHLSQYIRFLDQDLKPGPPEHKAGILRRNAKHMTAPFNLLNII